MHPFLKYCILYFTYVYTLIRPTIYGFGARLGLGLLGGLGPGTLGTSVYYINTSTLIVVY